MLLLGERYSCCGNTRLDLLVAQLVQFFFEKIRLLGRTMFTLSSGKDATGNEYFSVLLVIHNGPVAKS
jgi:hypothetical protein